MTSHHYHSRPTRRLGQQMTGLELALTAFTLVAVIAVIIIFLFVLHDVPLRVA